MTTHSPARDSGGRFLALAGIVLVALNLRTAVAALSPIFDEISVDVPLNAVGIGFLGMLPPICFAVLGILAPLLHRRFGLERVLVLGLVAIVCGHVVRATATDFVVIAGGSALTFAGMGLANVLLPPLVKKYFPDRIGTITAVYATVMALGSTLPPLIAVPVADSAGWRTSVGMWAVFGLLAIVPWVIMVASDARDRGARRASTAVANASDSEQVGQTVAGGESADSHGSATHRSSTGRVWRTGLGWALMLLFALTSMNAYAMFAWLPSLLRDSGAADAAGAGALLSLYTAMGFPAALIVPVLAARLKNTGILVAVGLVSFVVGYLGLLLVPSTLPWLWVSFAGIGPLMFPLTLVLINLRTRTHEGAVALSGFVQGIGYGIAAIGPLLVGLFHDVSGSWTWPILFLLATVVAMVWCGIVSSRPVVLEDEWGASSTT